MSEWRICASIQCVIRCTNPELLTHRDMFSCQENAFENVVCKTAAILCCFQCINSHWCPFSQTCSMATGITKRDLAIPPSAATMAWHPDKPLAFVLHNVYSKQVKGWRNQMETFPRYWPFVRGIHRSPVDSPHKGPVTRTLMFSLICAWTHGWANNRDAGDLRRHHAHHDVTVMQDGYFPYIHTPCNQLALSLTISGFSMPISWSSGNSRFSVNRIQASR